MKSARPRRGSLQAAALGVLGVMGCIAEHPEVPPVGGGGSEALGGAGGGGPGCAPIGAGRVDLRINGLPEGVEAAVVLRGPSGSRAIFASTVLEGIPAGPHVIEPARVADRDPLVRTVYEASASPAEFCLADSTSVLIEVDHAAVPTSHHLWTNSSNGNGDLLGFSAVTLAGTTSAEPDVAATAGAGKDLTFDAEGNLWSMGATVSDPHVMRFAGDALAATGEKRPDRSLDIEGIGCLPALRAFAFDREGALWISTCGGRIVELGPGDLAAGDVTADDPAARATVTPSVHIEGVEAAGDLAFDVLGNLWVVADSGVLRFDAERLSAPAAAPPDLLIALGGGDAGATITPSNLAFDASGNLWVIDFGGNQLARIELSDLQGRGQLVVAPTLVLTIGVAALLERPAFDESGGLWLALDRDRFGRLSAEQLLAASGPGEPILPEIVITSPSMGNANRMALYPAPAALPLYHRF